MEFSAWLHLPSDATHVVDDRELAAERLAAGGSTSANVPIVDRDDDEDLVLHWPGLEADTAWQAAQRARAVAHLLVDDFDQHMWLRIDVEPGGPDSPVEMP